MAVCNLVWVDEYVEPGQDPTLHMVAPWQHGIVLMNTGAEVILGYRLASPDSVGAAYEVRLFFDNYLSEYSAVDPSILQTGNPYIEAWLEAHQHLSFSLKVDPNDEDNYRHASAIDGEQGKYWTVLEDVNGRRVDTCYDLSNYKQ